MNAEQHAHAPDQTAERPPPGLPGLPAECPAAFDAARCHVSDLLMTMDWCSGTVISEERIEHVGRRWSPVRPPLVVSAVVYLADCHHGHPDDMREVA